ncbi:hypothetical protein [Streptomyces sp. NPDC058272]|uniref:hypothetical protein n=1 Tax=Streptomyces sp. NPDC058272 TaxID=3346415 RepID=UPI0036EB5B7A
MTETPKRARRAGHGEDTIYWDPAKNRFVGLGHAPNGKRRRPKVYGKTKTEVRTKIRDLKKEMQTGVKSPANYTGAEAVNDWLGRGLKGRDEQTVNKNRSLAMRNVALLVAVPEGRPGRPSKALNLEQAKAVLAAARGSRLYAYLVVSVLSGVRTKEARPLAWDHVYLSPPEGVPPHVVVWRSVRKHGEPKTRKSRRTIAPPKQVVDVLEEHLRWQKQERA